MKKKKTKNGKVIEIKPIKVLKKCPWFKNYQQRNFFKSNGGNNEKLSSKFAVPKFQK